MHILTLSHFLPEVVYTPEFWNQSSSSISKSIKVKINKKHTNHIRQLCIGKDQLISVKHWLNFTKVENWVNQY